MSDLRHREFDQSEQAAIARLFSAGVIRELATRGKSPLLGRLVAQTGLFGYLPPNAPLKDLFDLAFGVMRRRPYRHEYVYKNALTQKVLLGTHSLSSATMLTEFRVGGCKADVVILNGTSVVYEIKSERDSLARLGRQLAAYFQVFDLVNVLVGANHLDATRVVVPEEVGLLVLSERFQLSTVRQARSNPGRLVPTKIFETLQRREAEQVLRECGRAVPKMPNTQMHSALRAAFGTMEPAETHLAFVEVLKRSRASRTVNGSLEALPMSLASAILSIRMRQCDRVRLAQAMDVTLAATAEWARN
jgi:hypothetical protein